MTKRYTYDDDGDEVLRDGESTRVPMLVMDAGGGRRTFFSDRVTYVDGDGDRPVFLRMADERDAVRSARDAMIRRAQNAWKDAGKQRPPDDGDDDDGDGDEDQDGVRRARRARGARSHERREEAGSVADARSRATAAYDARTAKLQNAWKTPPDYGARPADLELMGRHLSGKPDDDGAPDRDRAWKDYCDNLQNAWRPDPRAAGPIENLRVRWVGK